MKFIPKRYVIKIPSEIFILYSEKNRQLIILDKTKKRVIDLKVKLKVFKDKNCIIVTDVPFLKTSNKLKKVIQGSTYFLVKKEIKRFNSISCKKLNLIGVGYKVFDSKDKIDKHKLLHFKLGYSHNIYYKVPCFLNIQIRNSNKIFIFGNDSVQVNKTSAIIKSYRFPEPYKGKGILYFNESIALKEGKKI